MFNHLYSWMTICQQMKKPLKYKQAVLYQKNKGFLRWNPCFVDKGCLEADHMTCAMSICCDAKWESPWSNLNGQE